MAPLLPALPKCNDQIDEAILADACDRRLIIADVADLHSFRHFLQRRYCRRGST